MLIIITNLIIMFIKNFELTVVLCKNIKDDTSVRAGRAIGENGKTNHKWARLEYRRKLKK